MKYLIGGKEYKATRPRVREVCEAEKALQMNAAEGVGAAIAVKMFAAIRQVEPDRPAFQIADMVLNSELDDDMILDDEEEAEQEEEASPPAEAPAEEEKAGGETEPDHESQPTSGPLRSVAQA